MNARALTLSLLLLPALTVIPALAQAPHTLTPAEQAKVDTLVHSMTLEQKLDYIGGTGFAIRSVPSLSIPTLEMSDGPYGTRSNAGFPSTTYSAGIGLAATWDRDLATRVGAGIGRDARARGVHFMLGPGVNIYRSPRNGRNFEYFGEDPYLAANMAVGYITGMQQQGVSATVKHFLGNNSEFLRHDSDSIIDERTLREIYLPTFEAAVAKAHVGAIMDSYNLINGAHATQNNYFNTDIARKEWHFTGVMMSDWSATYDGVAAANNGLDLEMPTGRFMNRATLLAAIQAGTVTEATIDEKIRHILQTAMSFNWLDPAHSQTDPSISFVDARNAQTALDSARESAVLLKNENHTLPLNKSRLKSILVVGPDAYPGYPVGGGSAGVVPFHVVSDLEGLTTALAPATTVFYDRGIPTLADLARATHFTGLQLETFLSHDLSGAAFTTRTVETISTEGGRRGPGGFGDDANAMMSHFTSADHQVSHRFTGTYTAPTAGTYILALQGEGESGGNRVLLDDKLILDNWSLVRADQPSLTLPLSAGPHKVVVEQWQNNPYGGRIALAIADAQTIVSPRALALAAKADAVVIAAGYAPESESEGGDRTFTLPYGQDQLINALAAVNPHTIVAITSGGNVDSTAWIDHVPALLETWYAGQSGGTALAELLLGQINPSGHLPATFERHAEDNPTFATYYPEADTKKVTYKEGIFVGYRGYEHNHTQPLFPFGFGLSYTTFAFSNLKVVPEFNSADPHVTVFFDIKNTGPVAGAEVAQVYVTEDHATVPRPLHELKGFDRIQLAPGETRHVQIQLDPRAFAYYDVPSKSWKINPGRYTISVGDNLQNLPLKGSIESPR
jgi:beta-glucosidase